MITLTLHKDKVTPGTVRYREDSDDHPITVYLTKARVADLGNPDTIAITIQKGGDNIQTTP